MATYRIQIRIGTALGIMFSPGKKRDKQVKTETVEVQAESYVGAVAQVRNFKVEGITKVH